MDIIEFRERVKVALKENGATFPGWEAEIKAVGDIAHAAIEYMDAQVRAFHEKIIR